MADKKISQLTGATTPLAGTEVLPIVQSGSTVKVAVSDLTAGRGVAATSLTLLNNASASSVAFSRTTSVARDWSMGIDGDGGFRLTDGTASVVALSSLPSALTFLASQGELAFKYSGTTEGMRLTSTGLGIGTANPAAKLDVIGTAQISGNVTFSGGTANGVLYLNGSKVATSGTALVFDGTNLGIGAASGTSTGYTTAPRLFGYNDGAFTSLLAGSGSSGSCQFRTALYRDATGSSSISMAKFRGTYASPAVVQNGDQAGILQWDVFAGTNIRRIGAIRGLVDTYTSDTQVGGYLTFETSRNADLSSGEKMRLTSAGNLKIGGSADRATTEGDKQLVIFNGTAPVGTLTNGISIYSSSGEAYVMDAAGNATLFSPHDSETNEWIFKSKHTPTGKVLRIDVEKLLRFVNDHFGLDAVKEFVEV